MNAERREMLAEVANAIDDVGTQIQDIIDEEQDAFEGLPEGLQNSRNGGKMQEAIELMEDLITQAEGLSKAVLDVVDKLSPKTKRKNNIKLKIIRYVKDVP